MYEPILANVAKHIRLSSEEASTFISFLTVRELPRKSMLLQEGQVCRELSFVQSGALRAFCTDKEGKESTIMFAIADWWVTDMYCFLNEQPAMMNIQAIEETFILQISKFNLDRLYAEVPLFERFFRILMQNAYTREQLRVIGNLTLTARERYENFMAKYPQIANMVTQKQIASYLGITPEFLSSIRKYK